MSTYTNRPVARRLPAIDIRKKTDQDKFPTNSSTQPGAETPGPTKEKQKRKKSRSTKRKSSTAPSEPSTATTKTESPHQRETSIVAKVSPQRTKFNVAGTSPQSKISPVSKESTVAETSSQQKSSTLTRPNKQGFVTKIVMSEEKITQVAASANSTSITHTKNLAKDLNTSLFSSIRLPSTMKGEEKSKPNKENEVPPINAKGLYKNLLHTRRAEVLCHELGLTLADVRRLRQKFNENDMYSTGEITQAEFFFLINEERCALTKGIFDLAGIKYDQKYIRFDEYLICVCRFAALTKPQLYEFLFQLFDIDQSGSLNENEFQLMSQELQSKQFHFSVRVMTAMKKLGKMDSNQSSKILDLKDFMRLVKSFPVAFYRIINLQNNVRARTLGEKYWSLLSGRKLKVDALLVQMRRNNGSLRPLTCQEKFWGMFDEEIYAIRKRVSEIYARELIERKDLLP